MEKVINIIVGIVVVAFTGYAFYLIQQKNIRDKELDKKSSDNLQQQKEINELIIEKLKNGKINLMSIDQNCYVEKPSANGKSKRKKVKLTDEKAN